MQEERQLFLASVESVPAGAAALAPANTFITPASPDFRPIMLLHRRHDGYISLHRKRGEQFENLCSVPANMLDGLWGQVAAELDEDSYFSVNGFFCGGRSPSTLFDLDGVALPRAVRSRNTVRWLTAAFVDIDCHKLGIDVATVIGALVDAQDRGVTPPASLITRSGRGVWLFWFLKHDRGEGPVRAWDEKLELWCSLQGAIGQLFAKVGSDAGARDVARVTRIAGSMNTKAIKRVAYWVQATADGCVPTYGLTELAQLFGVPQLEKRRRPPPAVDGVVAMLKARARKGNAGRWRKAMQNFRRLWQLRGRFKEGTRSNACWVYASLLRSQPRRITEADVQTAVEKLWRHGCEWTSNWTTDDLQAALRGSRRLAGIRNQVLSDRLDVTPEESALLDNWPPATRFKGTDDQAVKLNRPQRTARRRNYLRHLIDRCPIMPTLRALEAALEEAGTKAAPATIAADLQALGIENARATTRKRRKRRRFARQRDPNLF